MKNQTKKKPIIIQTIILKLVIIWAIFAFVIFPNVNLFTGVFYQNGQFSAEVFKKVFHSARAMKSLTNSFILAFTLVITVNIVGTLCVLFTEYWDIKGAKILRLAYMSSLIYGGVVLVSGYKYVYGANGLLTKLLLSTFPNMNPNWFVGYGAVVFVMTFACTQNHMMFLKNAIHGLDYYTIEAAKNMGASGMRIFCQIVMPVLKPTFFAITILTFLTGLGAMAAPLIVGGDDFQTINPMIINFAKSSYSRDVASFLAILLGIATIILLSIFSKIEKGGNYISVSKTKAKLQKQKINNPAWNVIAHVTAYIMFLIYVIPIILVIIYSLCDSLSIKTGNITLASFTLENYQKLFTSVEAVKPYLVSIIYSLLAAVIAAVIAIICARFVRNTKHKYDMFFEYGILVPWLLPSTLIALGLTTTYGEKHAILFNYVLVGTLALMLIGYTVAKLPFSYRMIKAAFFGVDNDLEEAAKCMGASTFYTMVKVVLPVILPAIMSVIILNFNGMLSDYDLSVFLYHPLFQPLGIVIKGASDETASIDAKAMSFVYTVVLMLLSSVALYFGQGDGMNRIKRWKQRRLKKTVVKG
ncbi:MAG: binding-protein-dependent transport system inner rane component [Clostridiales bacterium]|nr:binding-protein-dependent transport system inner rane component [Clostridiales bacterium]